MPPPDDADSRAELLSPPSLVPSLQHAGVKVWDTLATGEYLHEIKPKAGLLPTDRQHAPIAAICGEMHSVCVDALVHAAKCQGHFPSSRPGQ
jgi:glutathione S-transferase